MAKVEALNNLLPNRVIPLSGNLENAQLGEALRGIQYGSLPCKFACDEWLSTHYGRLYTPAKLAGAFPLIQHYAGTDPSLSHLKWIELRIEGRRFIVAPEKGGFLDELGPEEQCRYQYGFLSQECFVLIARSMQPEWHPVSAIPRPGERPPSLDDQGEISKRIPLTNAKACKEALAKIGYIQACDIVLQVPRMISELSAISEDPELYIGQGSEKALTVFTWYRSVVGGLNALASEASRLSGYRSPLRVIDHDVKGLLSRIRGYLDIAVDDMSGTVSIEKFIKSAPRLLPFLDGLLCCGGALGMISRPLNAHRDILRGFDPVFPYDSAVRYLTSSMDSKASIEIVGPREPMRASVLYIGEQGARNALEHGATEVVLTFGTHQVTSGTGEVEIHDFVSIRDNGPGIRKKSEDGQLGSPRQARDLIRIFGSTTTKPEGKGGFGLSSTLLVVKRFCGFLSVVSVTLGGRVEYSRRAGPLRNLKLEEPKESGALLSYSLSRTPRLHFNREPELPNPVLSSPTLKTDFEGCVLPPPPPRWGRVFSRIAAHLTNVLIKWV